MSLKELRDKAKHTLFEDDNTSKVPASVTPASHEAPIKPTVPAIGFSYPAGAAVAAVPSVDNAEVYEQIKAKTDFDNTQAGQILNKYLLPLANLPLDQAMKLKTALAQASAQDGISVDKILATFDGLKVALQNEVNAFNDAANNQIDHEITSRQNRIQEINSQIAQLQAEQVQLSTELATIQAKISATTTKFQFAASRRGAEIDQQKAQFAIMLK